MPADLTPIQTAMDQMETAVAANDTVDGSTEILLDRLSSMLLASAADPETIRAIAEGLTNKAGRLQMSNDRLVAAVTRNTPAENPTE